MRVRLRRIVVGMAFVVADLEAIEDLIRTRISGGAVQEYEVEGRRIEREPLDVLYALRNRMRQEVSLASNPGGTALVNFRRSAR